MSEDLQKLSNSMYDNQVGKLWAQKGFLSLKPLGSDGEVYDGYLHECFWSVVGIRKSSGHEKLEAIVVGQILITESYAQRA